MIEETWDSPLWVSNYETCRLTHCGISHGIEEPILCDGYNDRYWFPTQSYFERCQTVSTVVKICTWSSKLSNCREEITQSLASIDLKQCVAHFLDWTLGQLVLTSISLVDAVKVCCIFYLFFYNELWHSWIVCVQLLLLSCQFLLRAFRALSFDVTRANKNHLLSDWIGWKICGLASDGIIENLWDHICSGLLGAYSNVT